MNRSIGGTYSGGQGIPWESRDTAVEEVLTNFSQGGCTSFLASRPKAWISQRAVPAIDEREAVIEGII